MRTLKSILLLAACSMAVNLSARIAGGKIENIREQIPETYNCEIYLPAGYNPLTSTNTPVVMFLHGRSMSEGLGGYKYGPIASIREGSILWNAEAAIVIEPNAVGNEGWSSQKLHKLYEFVKEHYAADWDRFYVIGMSMGGWGTLNYVNKYYDEVAACVGICGGCDTKKPCGLNKVPTVIIHAADDATTSVKYSDAVVEGMKQCGPTDLLKYVRLSSGGHSLIDYFLRYNLYDWLFKHNRNTRKLYPEKFTTEHAVMLDENVIWNGASVKTAYIDAEDIAKIKARTPNRKAAAKTAASKPAQTTTTAPAATKTSTAATAQPKATAPAAAPKTTAAPAKTATTTTLTPQQRMQLNKAAAKAKAKAKKKKKKKR